MSPENVQEDLAEELLPAAVAFEKGAASGTATRHVVAFKFGGTSLLGAERMFHAAGLVRDAAKSSQVAVIVSAMKGVTDRLLAISQWLENGQWLRARTEAEAAVQFHLDVLSELRLEETAEQRVRHELRLLGRDLLHEVPAEAHGARPPFIDAAWQDRLASFGERFSARLFSAALEKSGVASVPVSSSDFVVTCDTFRDAKPDLHETRRRGREILLPLFEDGLVPVVTGFLGATRDGRVTTLGRNSSDYSGAIIAHVVDADELVIWTDVDGVFTANPNESAEATLLHELSYDEAHALASSGARVLHANVLPLAAEREMLVWVRNTFKPHNRGTKIGPMNRNASRRGDA
ncbi:MAG TPA: aspartate kinase [Terriglobales bacterium]|nr:aspartate kinase [Terriglobales bacterium]